MLGIIFIQKWLEKPSRKLRWHQIILGMPVFGEISAQINASRFASTLALLAGSGVPLLDAIKISTQVMTNAVMMKATEKLAVDVQEGSSVACDGKNQAVSATVGADDGQRRVLG
ncbi:hypothetical protein [Simiduia agarivorans]|uniref:hypothetical protein n=1 Tax=Simiduia agarivorans TaxID=447471 RepID=UPI000309BC28|nr:hypothetical protein [Simiduia agarivorans]